MISYLFLNFIFYKLFFKKVLRYIYIYIYPPQKVFPRGGIWASKRLSRRTSNDEGTRRGHEGARDRDGWRKILPKWRGYEMLDTACWFTVLSNSQAAWRSRQTRDSRRVREQFLNTANVHFFFTFRRRQQSQILRAHQNTEEKSCNSDDLGKSSSPHREVSSTYVSRILFWIFSFPLSRYIFLKCRKYW